MDAWGNFATTGNPNFPRANPALPSWPVFAADQKPFMYLSAASRVERAFKAEICDFWDQKGYNF